MSGNNTKIAVKVQPNSGRNQVVGYANGIWRIKIAAPPDKGKANKELIEYLRDILDLRKDDITIVRGETSHNKLIAINGISEEEAGRRLGGKE